MSGIVCAMYLLPGTGCTLLAEEGIIVGGWTILGIRFFVWSKLKYKELLESIWIKFYYILEIKE